MYHRFRLALALSRLLLIGGVVSMAMAFTAEAQGLRIGGTGSALGTIRLMADAFAKQDSKQATLTVVPNLGSSGAMRALQAGAIDAALISRPLKPEEIAAGFVAYEYGRSPFVFVTSKSSVKNISTANVADVLAGRSAFWPDSQPVRFVMRPQSDGDNAYLAGFSPEIEKALKIAHQRQGLIYASTDQEAADEAERLPGSLAANTLALVLSEQRKLNIIALNGVTPSVKALASGAYPYSKPLAIVTRGAPSGAVLQFLEFIKSSHGRSILEANGHLVAP